MYVGYPGGEMVAPHFMGQLKQLISRVRAFSHCVGPLPGDLFGPEFLEPGTGVAPHKILGMPFFIMDLHLLG